MLLYFLFQLICRTQSRTVSRSLFVSKWASKRYLFAKDLGLLKVPKIAQESLFHGWKPWLLTPVTLYNCTEYIYKI